MPRAPALLKGGSTRCLRRLSVTGAAILADPVSATLKRVDAKKHIEATVDRERLWAAQTPQVFRRELLLKAYAARGDKAVTDDASLVEALGQPVTVVSGSPPQPQNYDARRPSACGANLEGAPQTQRPRGQPFC